MSRRTKKSLIPPNAQVPVAIVLGVFFAVILAWRFWPKGTIEAVPAPGVAIEIATSADADVTRLQSLVEQLQTRAPVRVVPGEFPRSLARNPFARAAWEIAEDAEGEVLPEYTDAAPPVAPVYTGPSIEERLAMLNLSGTAQHGGFKMAMVNGRYLRTGDEIDGFKVKSIHEKYIVLVDDSGENKLQISTPPLFETVMIEPPVDGETTE